MRIETFSALVSPTTRDSRASTTALHLFMRVSQSLADEQLTVAVAPGLSAASQRDARFAHSCTRSAVGGASLAIGTGGVHEGSRVAIRPDGINS